MQNNKLYHVLTKFDKYEQNRLRKFIDSPYFNRNERLLKLFDLLTGHINGQAKKALEKRKIWKALGFEGELDDVRLRKDFSDLLKLVERFLAQEEFSKNELFEKELLYQSLNNKGLKELENSVTKKTNLLLKKYPLRSSDFFFHKFSIEKKLFISNQNSITSEKKNIEQVSNNLDIFYFSEKLRYYCFAISSKRISTHEYNLEFIDTILENVKNSKFLELPVVAVYYQFYLTLIDGNNEVHYFKFKELLEKYSLEFPKDEAFNLYSSALNYCTRKINSGLNHFLQEYFEVHLDFIEKEIIFIGKYLQPSHFNNIIVAALRLEKYNWVEVFIKKYQGYIEDDQRENIVTFNTARLHWYKKEHEKVIELLREVEYENIGYNLRSKIILIATYYETDEIDPLFSLLESFRAFLNRHKEIPPHRRKIYLNLISFTKKLVKIIPGDKKAINKVRKEINETKALVNKEWLEEKLAELE